MSRKEIDKEEINQLPLLEFKGDIHLLSVGEDLSEALEQWMAVDLLGFDTEAKPSFRKGQYHPTCLIQLATESQAWIVRLDKKVPNEILTLLEAAQVTKVGLGLRDDLKDLNRLRPFRPASFVDVSTIASEAGYPRPGLKHLAALLLGRRISKSQQTSNWEAPKLSQKQLIYAATDAWLPLQIYESFIEEGLA